MQTLKTWQEEPLACSLKMDAEVSGFLSPGEKHTYLESLPMGRYELEIIECQGSEIHVLDQFNDPLTELSGSIGDSEIFYVPGRELVFVEVRNATRGDLYYSFKLRRNPRQLMIQEAYLA